MSAVTTVNVTVARYLSITNTSSLEFGNISVSATAGAVVIDDTGMRFATGGVTINPAGSFNPAKFIIEGKPNANFAIKLPYKIELRDSNGNIIDVTDFKSSDKSGTLDINGIREISVGGQINLDPNQATGDYTGTMIVELNYM
ncbi:MAG: DUF4402 domain-containing protein [Gammaproteobacteria bacterium]|nr:DUF4402 domain-containing protein [Gammaproteobacteria bacterium]